MLRFVLAEEVVSPARTSALSWRGVVNRFVLPTCLLVLLGFLILMTWRELVSQFDASIRDFASSLDTNGRAEPQ